jgi:hypothetical protein
MKQIYILFALGIILVFSSCHNNPTFNGEELKSLLKEKTGIIIEDSLTITDFEWSVAIGDYYEEYVLKCSQSDHQRMLNHAIKNDWENVEGWENVAGTYNLIIPQISFSDTFFIFSIYKDKQQIRILIAEE